MLSTSLETLADQQAGIGLASKLAHQTLKPKLQGVGEVCRTRTTEFGMSWRSTLRAPWPCITAHRQTRKGLGFTDEELSGKMVPHSGFCFAPSTQDHRLNSVVGKKEDLLRKANAHDVSYNQYLP